jgi:hypothetical protein
LPPRQVSSTLYYWWLDFQGEQDSPPVNMTFM